MAHKGAANLHLEAQQGPGPTGQGPSTERLSPGLREIHLRHGEAHERPFHRKPAPRRARRGSSKGHGERATIGVGDLVRS